VSTRGSVVGTSPELRRGLDLVDRVVDDHRGLVERNLGIDAIQGADRLPPLGGGNIGEAIDNTAKLLAAARKANVPIAYARVVYADDGSDSSVFCLKSPNLAKLTESAPGSQIVDALSPEPGDYIVRRIQPSAFFGTNLAAWLIGAGIDTVIVTGCTTSGCVRASVVDSMSYNFKTIVATDCVGDRAMAPHRANLFDMEQKYADMMTSEEIIPLLSE